MAYPCVPVTVALVAGGSVQPAGRRESMLGKPTVRCLSSRTLCFTPLVWELTRGSCSSAWATMSCICGAGSPTPLRCNRWKPRPGRRSTRNNWKGEPEHKEQGWAAIEPWFSLSASSGYLVVYISVAGNKNTNVFMKWGIQNWAKILKWRRHRLYVLLSSGSCFVAFTSHGTA